MRLDAPIVSYLKMTTMKPRKYVKSLFSRICMMTQTTPRIVTVKSYRFRRDCQ
jgi:hypothetical protein